MEELIPYEVEPPAIGGEDLLSIARRIEERVEAVKRIKRAVLAVTTKNDWVDQGGRPYLAVSGAEKLRALFGISWRIDPPEIEQLEDGHYNVIFKGYFSMSGTTIEVLGTRSSRDPFFSKRGGQAVDPKEVDKNDVVKAALTNCIGNGITRLLGLRGLTWEEIEGAGIARDQVSRVEYWETEDKVEQMRSRIHDMLLEVAGDEKAAANLLEELSTWESKDGKKHPGKRYVTDLSKAQVPVVYGQVKRYYEAWLEDQGRMVVSDE